MHLIRSFVRTCSSVRAAILRNMSASRDYSRRDGFLLHSPILFRIGRTSKELVVNLKSFPPCSRRIKAVALGFFVLSCLLLFGRRFKLGQRRNPVKIAPVIAKLASSPGMGVLSSDVRLAIEKAINQAGNRNTSSSHGWIISHR